MEKILLIISGVCMVLAFFSLIIGKERLPLILVLLSVLSYGAGCLYNTPIVSWMCIEGNLLWNVTASIIGAAVCTLLLLCFFFSAFWIVQYVEDVGTAKAANMSTAEFRKWKKQMVDSLAQKIENEGLPVTTSLLYAAYRKEEEKLLRR